ncbi:CHAP domain-containing protein [Actinomadura madurae]|uniref:CHAP domain-containing protein n=1 Tax=Actinomadura madurae TaxID=1993 RepID=UPI0020D24402|nr:CHAP domain-containing protein [Actinomadura madurae]MCP9971555.1 CHAP domain-containing protein [Actinomadura madurae]
MPKKPAAKAPGKPSAKPSGASRPTAAEAIELARSQVGVEEDRGGETKFQKWYMGTARAKETLARDGGSLAGYGDANWCDMFVSWVGERIGFGDQIGSDAWTVAHARWFKKHGRWGTEPRPGAIVFYAWDGGKDVTDIRHVGMVIKKIDARRHRGGRGQHRQRRADQEAVGRRRRRLRLPRLPVLMTRSS